jgi:histidinol-phosphatase (PHP family)
VADELRRVLSSLHTHSRYCDGSGEPEDYVRAAADRGLAAVGLSAHSPLPFERDCAMPLSSLAAYRAEGHRLRRAYADTIPCLLGLEIDYVPGLTGFYEAELVRLGFDFFVASVHFVGGPGGGLWNYDDTEELFAAEIDRRFGGDPWPLIENYYRRVGAMVKDVRRWGLPVIVGHLDRIAIWNRDDRHFPTRDARYLALVDEALDAIAGAGLTLELNTSHWVKGPMAPNPALSLLPRCARRGIPVILSADAHHPSQIDLEYDRGAAALVEAGYDRVVLPGPGSWGSAPLPAPAVEPRGAAPASRPDWPDRR